MNNGEIDSRNGKKNDDTSMSLSLMICHDIECNNEDVSDPSKNRQSRDYIRRKKKRILCQLNDRNLSKNGKNIDFIETVSSSIDTRIN